MTRKKEQNKKLRQGPFRIDGGIRKAYLRAMTTREIITIPDAKLREVSKAVERIDDDLLKLLDDMAETMMLIQLGLPGPLQVFDALPDARAILTYPMSIAPVVGVPLFVLVNLWLVWALYERAWPPSTKRSSP